ncbi:hypothetical protein ALC57_11625 [Trachymyrmex cornetzi]|uniref:Uncharacterized protein n=1 Tax=Trachymyrmex cornetzi TaxID=471704 RepID=A0A195DT48_9HYME|nr:hypothetical protein ALC57_11625 [Trachymyrmex cornetzi]
MVQSSVMIPDAPMKTSWTIGGPSCSRALPRTAKTATDKILVNRELVAMSSRDINNLAHSNNRASWVVPLFMYRRHFIGQDVLVSAILDSKVHRRRAYQPAEQHSPKRGRDIAIGGEDGSVP